MRNISEFDAEERQLISALLGVAGIITAAQIQNGVLKQPAGLNAQAIFLLLSVSTDALCAVLGAEAEEIWEASLRIGLVALRLIEAKSNTPDTPTAFQKAIDDLDLSGLD